MKLVSVVVPVFNESQSIFKNAHTIIKTVSANNSYNFEFIFVDDGSSDETSEVINTIGRNIPNLLLITFTRNFGKEAAILAGLIAAKGDAAIVMDSDLQHPPELINKMLTHWQNGYLVAEAVKVNRGLENPYSKLSAKLFYLLMRLLTDQNLDGQSDFKLLDREVLNSYLALPEKQRFFRGLISWLGYTSVQIPFEVPERSGTGGSKWGLLRLIKYAIKNISIFTSFPLRLVSLLGGFTLLFGFVFGATSLWQKIEGKALSGFTTVNLLIVVLSGSILISIGVIGHYLALIYDEIKGRPIYITKNSSKKRDF